VFCSFLALILRKELDERCRRAGFRPEWGDVQRDLDRYQEVTISKEGRQMILRTPATGVVGPLFKAARIALPPNVRDARCLVLGFDGAFFSPEWKEALWARFFMGAPARQSRSVERYNIVKRA